MIRMKSILRTPGCSVKYCAMVNPSPACSTLSNFLGVPQPFLLLSAPCRGYTLFVVGPHIWGLRRLEESPPTGQRTYGMLAYLMCCSDCWHSGVSRWHLAWHQSLLAVLSNPRAGR